MSLYELQSYLFRLKSDPTIKKDLAENAEEHLARLPLTPPEKEALRNVDVVALWKMGVHPLLLIPFAQAMKMPPAEYKRTLAPLIGQRKFRS